MNKGNNLTNSEQFAFEAIRRYPGRTAKQIERLMNDFDGRIHKRVSTLVKKGRVIRTYPTDCKEALLYPVKPKFNESLF